MGVKISELTEASAAQSTDVLPIVQNGETKKIKKENLFSDTETEIEELRSQTLRGTDWQEISLNSGFTQGALASSGNLMVKRIGNIVYLKGSISGFTALSQVCGTLPVGYRPATRIDVYASYSGTKTANCVIGGNGSISLVNTQDGSISSNNWVAICATWVTDENFPS